ncbi:hypothetical protein BST43_19715 [Mycobacteroides saopaulense]|uniref:Uncharacterized protein n=1 Tax=Mycobacteroides saopaulense TaxID=1578165 RepID=A0A1X0ITE6_9MYCO|nr:hypothetical protein BST43_19715 [Mycobacteroides saopaulense]
MVRSQRRAVSAPAPNCCRWCGTDERMHAIEWSTQAGYHRWIAPTDAQRKSRMVARRGRGNGHFTDSGRAG